MASSGSERAFWPEAEPPGSLLSLRLWCMHLRGRETQPQGNLMRVLTVIEFRDLRTAKLEVQFAKGRAWSPSWCQSWKHFCQDRNNSPWCKLCHLHGLKFCTLVHKFFLFFSVHIGEHRVGVVFRRLSSSHLNYSKVVFGWMLSFVPS